MFLTLHEAAARLGKTPRQVRYLITQGKVRAEKRAGRWMVDLDSLPRTDGQEQAKTRRREALRDAVDETLGTKETNEETRRRYSVRDLKAFQVAQPLHARIERNMGSEHPATQAIRRSLEHLSRGCHRFAREEKAVSYREARDAASQALCALLLDDGNLEQTSDLADLLEQELMPAFAGILRRIERKARW